MHRPFRRQRGQGIVEFAAIFPFFAMMLFILVDGGILLGRYNNVNNAAKEGARLGAVGATEAEIVDRVKAQTHGLLDDSTSTDCGSFDSEPKAICVEWIEGPSPGNQQPGTVGSSVRVKVRYDYDLLSPIDSFISDAFPGWEVIEACSVHRLERSVSDVEPVNETGC